MIFDRAWLSSEEKMETLNIKVKTIYKEASLSDETRS